MWSVFSENLKKYIMFLNLLRRGRKHLQNWKIRKEFRYLIGPWWKQLFIQPDAVAYFLNLGSFGNESELFPLTFLLGWIQLFVLFPRYKENRTLHTLLLKNNFSQLLDYLSNSLLYKTWKIRPNIKQKASFGHALQAQK